MSFDLFGPTYSLLAKALDLRSQRHAVIASNIANADTPGYRAAALRFEDELAKAMPGHNGLGLTRTDPAHLPHVGLDAVQPSVVYETGAPQRIDGNTVDLDAEIVALSKNQLMYNALAQILRQKFDGLSTMIREMK